MSTRCRYVLLAVVLTVLVALPAAAFSPDPVNLPPALVAPADGAVGNNFTLQWTAVQNATDYDVHVDDDPSFPSPSALPVYDETKAQWPEGPFWCPDTYYWRVRGTNSRGDGPWSETRSFTKPAWAPNDLTPDDGTIHASGATVRLNANAGHTQYQVARDAGFADLVVDELVYNNEDCVCSGLADGWYHWRAAAVSQYCGQGPWSAARTFALCPAAAAPGMNAPADGTTVDGTGVELDWIDDVCADAYAVHVDRDDTFSCKLVDAQTVISYYRISGTLVPDTYFWRVAAIRQGTRGPWSEVRRFIVDEESHVAFVPVVRR